MSLRPSTRRKYKISTLTSREGQVNVFLNPYISMECMSIPVGSTDSMQNAFLTRLECTACHSQTMPLFPSRRFQLIFSAINDAW